MGSVVGELRISLSELEKSLDLFFRNPQDKAVLAAVPGQLSQMRGVLSVLGLDQASHAVLRMRDSVEQMLVTEVDEQLARSAGTFDQLGNNLGALSFLIDMLNYQPALAKKLFVYDEAKGELKPLMGRSQGLPDAAVAVSPHGELSQEVLSVVHDAQAGLAAATLSDKLDVLATHAALADQPALAETARNAAAAVASNTQANSSSLTDLVAAAAPAPVPVVAATASEDFEEDDLRDIFLEEAREVAGQAQAALAALAAEPGDIGEMTILRRAFHTLKGSSRMVGLNEFGEAAWSMEQLLNGWLAEQKSSDDSFRALCVQAMEGFAVWIDDIAANRDAAWKAAPFRNSAEAMRTGGLFVAIALPQGAASVTLPVEQAVQVESAPSDAGTGTATDFDFDFSMDAGPATGPVPAAPEQPVVEIQGIDFDSLSSLSADPVVAGQVAPGAVFELDLDEPDPVADQASPVELSDVDFDAHFLAPASPEEVTHAPTGGATPAAAEAVSEFAANASGEQAPVPEIESTVNFEDFSESAAVESAGDEQVKVIGSLRIGIPLYNVYLNEADEWSRRLVTEVTEWTMEHGQPIGDSTLALTHSLAGSSSTVGFDALSEMARALEHALQQSQIQPDSGGFRHGQLFIDAAEDIRRLLHQFAAGFLKQPDPKILQALRDIDFSEPTGEPVPVAGNAEVPVAAAAPPVAPAPAAAATKFIIKAVTSAPVLVSAAPSSAAAAVVSAPEPAPARVASPEPSAPAAASSQQLVFNEDMDDEFDAVDVIDPDLFPIFEEEGAELMPQLGAALRQWAARPDNLGARNEVLRALHTLKGSARLAGAMRLGEMAHRIESDIEHMGSDAAASQDFDALLATFDGMQANFEAQRHPGTAGTMEPLQPLSPAATDAGTDETPGATGTAVAPAGGRKVVMSMAQATALQPLRPAASGSIRVRSQLLDRMVNQAGEVMITRSRLEAELNQLRGSLNDLSGNLNRLRSQLRDVEMHSETQMQSRLQQAKEAQL
ncbi:MAG: Hpt domain-containing protein, partial [Polaromonas sp.]|nr:Hpt domain-containing protein [Polaromonas sp.]